MRNSTLWLTVALPNPELAEVRKLYFFLPKCLIATLRGAIIGYNVIRSKICYISWRFKVHPIILCWFYWVLLETCDMHYEKMYANNKVDTKELIYTPKLLNAVYYISVDLRYNIWFCIAEVPQFTFLCNIIMSHTNLNKSQTTFQAVLAKTY